MCLYPRLMRNKKYVANAKNGGNIPQMRDGRLKYVSIGCGRCIECMTQKSNAWRIRLQEEFKHDRKAKFLTLTFSEEELDKLEKEAEVKESNAIATIAVRRFLGRWRKSEKKSVKHWLITELGTKRTERIHLHGLLWTDKPREFIQEKWKYGGVWEGEYVNEKTINYITKYITKLDNTHKGYIPKVLTSPGIGKDYVNSGNFEKNKYKPNETNETYILNNGAKTALPIYYRNKAYTEEERELLWIEKLDNEKIYVLGEEIDISTKEGELLYFAKLKAAQEKNKRLGYGDDSDEWKRKEYNTRLKDIKEIKINEKD